MSTEQPQTLMSYADYMAYPDEGRHELYDGVLVLEPGPGLGHQRVQLRLAKAIDDFLEAHPVGEVFTDVDVVLREPNPARIVRPDLTFVANGSRAVLRKPNVAGPPDLVVEILSPWSARRDAMIKRAYFDEHGVGEYWMVLPDVEQVEVLRRGENSRFGRPTVFEAGDVLTTPALPGFALDVSKLFAPPRGQS